MEHRLMVGMILILVIGMIGCAAKQSGTFSTSSEDMITCTVCGKEAKRDLKNRLGYKGEKYWFCSQECLARFRENPSLYVGEEASEGEEQ